MAKNSVKKALLRLPEPLWKSLKRTAKKENRSMHGQILEILEEAQKPKTPMMVSITEINDAQTRTANSSTGITIPEPETFTI